MSSCPADEMPRIECLIKVFQERRQSRINASTELILFTFHVTWIREEGKLYISRYIQDATCNMLRQAITCHGKFINLAADLTCNDRKRHITYRRVNTHFSATQ